MKNDINIMIDFLTKIDELANKDIPISTMIRAKQSLLDYICVTLAGAKYNDEKIKKYLDFVITEEGTNSAIGVKKELALKETVFLNGLNGHALDYDDGTNMGIIHLGTPIYALLLPLADKLSLTIEQVLTAAIIGYEVSFTLALSIQPAHKLKGYHATGTCGTIGATIAACYLLDFSFEEKKQAFAIACTSATGMLNVLDGESELKPYNAAKAALLALSCLQMAKANFKGESDALSGSRGFFKMMAGDENLQIKELLFNGTYAVDKTYTKPYAACRYCHPAIEAAIEQRNNFKIGDIRKIKVKTYDLAVYGHDHVKIENSASAKMSIPYGVAVGLLYGKAGLNEYTDDIIQETLKSELCQKIIVEADETLTSLFPEEQVAILEIETINSVFSSKVNFPKGEPENPMTPEEFKRRYMELCTFGGIKISSSEYVFDKVMCGKDKISEILKML